MPDTTDSLALKTLATQLADTCPDLRELARQYAQAELAKYGLGKLEPDHVWWHRWRSSASSSRTFTGWQHIGVPYESMTLPQLVMHRFNASDQDNADNLQQMAGFYTGGPHANLFDEHNEVRLLPADVLRDFWAIDFAGQFRKHMADYWASNSESFRTLAKVNYLAKALEDRVAKRISSEQLKLLTEAVAGEFTWPVTLATLNARAPQPANCAIYAFDILGYTATDILRIVDAHQRQYLYVPGEVDAFHCFENEHDLYGWVLNETNGAENRARFMSHFPLSTHGEGKGVGLNHALDLLCYHGGHEAKPVCHNTQAIEQDPFDFLTQSTRSRMHADADFSLRSNADLRKQMWIGYLSAFSRSFAGFAALDWPIALAVVGAGLAEMGLNIDQAINGHTTAERKAGVSGAIWAGIDTLFNSLFLLKAGVIAEETQTIEAKPEFKPLETGVLSAEVEPLLPEPLRPSPLQETLAPFETNDIVEGPATADASGRMRGIQVNDQGTTVIEIDSMVYQVRYVSDMQTWVIVDPENPYSFYRNVPVRLTQQGTWEVLPRAGLKGGIRFFGRRPWGSATPAEAPVTLTPTYAYDMPEAMRGELEKAANGLADNVLTGDFGVIRGAGEVDPFEHFRSVRQSLADDAAKFFAEAELPARPNFPALENAANERTIITELLKESPGLVIGEDHACIASKKFLIDNMSRLAKQGVRTVYMEHLLTDFQQVDLDAFARTGKLSEKLENYLRYLDVGFNTDPSGRYNFLELVKSAGRHHIRVQAIDCMASYRQAGMLDLQGTTRQQMMNFFASRVIRADQALRGTSKWVALVGNTHANTFEGVPGVAELEGAIGLRIDDVPLNAPSSIQADPGVHAPGNSAAAQEVFVKNDLLYQSATLRDPAAAKLLEQRLDKPGMFGIDERRRQIIHRSGDQSLVYTPIQRDGAYYYIKRPRWAFVSDRRFDSLKELVTALQVLGMKFVG